MTFCSILFERPPPDIDAAAEPSFFADLNLDQVVEAATVGRKDYNLTPFFYTPLHDVDAVHYRHEVLHDLEKQEVAGTLQTFEEQMREMRRHLDLAKKLYYPRQGRRWFLDAVLVYCRSVTSLAGALDRLDPASRGLRAFRDYIASYVASEGFISLQEESQRVRDALAGVRYSVHIKGNHVRVNRYEGEPDYSVEIENTFSRFQRGAVKDYRTALREIEEMNHVEARILDLVARLFPEEFGALDAFCARRRDFLDPTIRAFDREIQFYMAYLAHVRPFRSAGLPFCYPAVSDSSRNECATDAFDIALAGKLIPENAPVVCNSFALHDPERVFVVTGPNQGGKTTFARMIGQVHYLAGLGLPVPGIEATLFLPDRIFTHFEKVEDLSTLRGKLEDELVRIHEILEQATGDSLIIMNESFASTTLNDTLFLGREVLEKVIELGALCVYVTFVDELASLNQSTVSMVSGIQPDNPAIRTFKIERRPADGLAYAAAIAEKYGLSYERLKRRIDR